MTIRIDDVHAIRLIASAAAIQFVPGIHHCIADYTESDQLKGGVLFTDYWGNGGSCQIHMAGFRKNWVSKSMLYLAFHYPFQQLGVKKLFGLVPERNHVARNSNLRLGFIVEYLAEDVFNHADGVNGMYLMSMRKEACKWLNMKMPLTEYASESRTSVVRALATMPTYNNLPAE